MNKPFTPFRIGTVDPFKPAPWRMKQVNALADELIRQMRAGEYQAPSRLLLHPISDVQFDTDRDRDEQGLAVGEKP